MATSPDSVTYPAITHGVMGLPDTAASTQVSVTSDLTQWAAEAKTSGPTATAVNLTTLSAFKVNSTQLMAGDIASANPSLAFGVSSGQSMTGGGANLFNTFMGHYSGQNVTTGNELAFFGELAGQNVTTGTFLTALGQHAMGWEASASSSTAVGNDSQRNYISAGQNTSVGHVTMYVGGGTKHTVLGDGALIGNGAAVLLTGTATAADVVTLTFSGSFTGSPAAISYTVQGGDTLGSIATGLWAAAQANTTVLATLLGGGSGSGVVDTNNLNFNWYGFAVGAITITPGVTGAATETVTVTNGSSGTWNVAIGQGAMVGRYHTSASWNVVIGAHSVGYALTTGGSNVIVGDGPGLALTTGSNGVYIGLNAGAAATTSNGPIAIGANALATQATPGFAVAVGSTALQNNVGATQLGNNQSNVAVGSGALAGGSGSTATTSVAVGAFAGNAVTTASGSVFVGTRAGTAVTTGNSSVYIGLDAGKSTNGNNAVVIGAIAGGAGTAIGSGVIIGQNSGAALTTGGSTSVWIGKDAANKATTGSGSVIIGQAVCSTTWQTGSNNIVIGNTSAVDLPAAATSNTINISNTLAGALTGATTPRIGAIGQLGVIGVRKTCDFNSTADQAITIDCLTSTSAGGYLSGATKYVITEIRVMNGSASLTTAQGGFYTGASKAGTIIGATTTAYTGCTGATTMQKLSALTNMDNNTFTATTINLSLTTAQGGAATADVYIMGYPLS